MQIDLSATIVGRPTSRLNCLAGRDEIRLGLTNGVQNRYYFAMFCGYKK